MNSQATATDVQDFYSQLRYPGPDALLSYLWAKRIAAYVPKDDFVFLDAGCGSGRHSVGLLDTYPAARGYCLDFSAPSLEEAKALAQAKNCADRANFIHASYLEAIDLPEMVDFAFAIGTIHHCPDPAGALRNIAAAVRPGGYVALMVYGERGHARRYEVKEAAHLLGSSPEEVLSLYRSYQQRYESVWDKSLRRLYNDLRNHLGQRVRRLMGRKSYGYSSSLNRDVFRADAILTPIDRAFNSHEVKELVDGAGLEPVAMFGLGRNDPALLPDGWRAKWEALPYWDQVRVMELIDPIPASWSLLSRRKPA